LARGDRIVDVRLQDGDVITIPEVSDSVLVSGEVVMPQSVVHTPGQGVMDYIASAGGFTRHADDDRILIARQNGEIVDAAGERPRSGDEIIVLPKVPTKNLQLAAAISEILYQIAVATRVAVDL
jgi:protein involved in polysaccharide export with SLBB domain